MSSYSEFFGGVPPKWVSGTTYALDRVVRSPISQHYYVRIVAGAGTTDPSADTTNWARIGPGGRKSIQEGSIVISPSDDAETATVSAVVMANRTLTLLGVYSGSAGGSDPDTTCAVVEMTNSTTITARRVGAGGGLTVRYQLEEAW